MKVGGFTFVRNAIRYDYPVVEAINSILPICDEFVVAVGKSEDDTLNLIQSIQSPKIKIIETTWDDTLREGGRVLAQETDKAFHALSPGCDWAFYIQADECIHEADLPHIKAAMQKWEHNKEVEGLLFKYRHFYGSYDYIGDSRRWYRNEIRIIRNDKSIASYKDAQGFRKDNRKLKVKSLPAVMNHYGWVKPPKLQQAKQEVFHRLWHDEAWMQKHIPVVNEFDYSNIDSLKKFEGTHPAVMHQRIAAKNWTFDFDPSKKANSIKLRLLKSIEDATGYRIGEYKNYLLLRLLFMVLFLGTLFSPKLKATPSQHEIIQDSLYNELSWKNRNSNINLAMKYADSALALAERIDYPQGLAAARNNIAVLQIDQGQYSLALDNMLKALKIVEQGNTPRKIAVSYLNIGTIYLMLKNYTQASFYLFKSLHIYETLDDKEELSKVYMNLGNVYGEQKNYKLSLTYSLRGLAIAKELNKTEDIFILQLNIGESYYWLGNYPLAIEYSNNAMQMSIASSNKFVLSATHLLLGQIYHKQQKFQAAITEFNLAISIAAETNNRNDRKESYAQLSKVYADMGDFKKGYETYQQYTCLKDSLLGEQSAKQITEMQSKYDFAKKNEEIVQLEKDKRRQRYTLIAVVSGSMVLLIAMLFVIKLYNDKKKTAAKLEVAYDQIEKKNVQIEKKNMLITDSITYAKKIQDAMLSGEPVLQQFLDNAFIFFQPKDIVSGDFYWLSKKEDHVFFAVGDCAGHGVPGAMMTMVGHSLLNEIVNDLKVFEPIQILSMLNSRIQAMPYSQKEGADHSSEIAMSLLVLGKDKVHIATAHQSVYLFRGNGMEEITGPPTSIGGIKDESQFTQIELPVGQNIQVFFSTDGYQDQFGGPKRKKFMKLIYHELLTAIAGKPALEQKGIVDQRFFEWKGQQDQTDDVLVIGFRV